MRPSTHVTMIDTFVPMLGTLSDLVEKGRAHARTTGRDPETLYGASLAPGMYGLGLQVRVACDHAIETTARMAGRAPPRRDGETPETLDGLQAEIERTVSFLRGVPASEFTERTIEMPLQGELVMEMSGERFVRDWALPLFYFHVVLAYSILRHEGVEIGVQDYLRHIADAIRPAR